VPKLAPCLWFDSQAEEAANFYVGIFPNSRTRKVTRYGKAGQEVTHQPEGRVLTVEFELDGQTFTALNGGPNFTFNEAISFQIPCKTQEEIDHYWDKLTPGGDPKAQQCGWLKDKFGVSWQVTPAILPELLFDPDKAKSERVMTEMLKMKKFDIAALKRASEG
jgi:predicted 3-demethylubiquinone-9 3-methyltransferase (glyoxalase superfamily)